MFCLSVVPLAVDSDVSADSVGVEAGQAWGQAIELDYDTLEPVLKGLVIDDMPIPPGVNLDEMSLTDILKLGLPEILKGMGFFDDFMVVDEVKELDIDLVLKEATLINVATADDDGYVIELSAGAWIGVGLDIVLKGKFPQAKTYDVDAPLDLTDGELSLKVNLDVMLEITGLVETKKNGAITKLELNVNASVAADIETNLKISFNKVVDEDGNVVYPEGNLFNNIWKSIDSITIGYDSKNPSKFGISVDLGISLGISASDDGLMIIPFELSATEAEKYNTVVTVDKVSITGKIGLSDDVKTLIDQLLVEGTADKILNLKIFGLKILENGELKINDLLNMFDFNDILSWVAVLTGNLTFEQLSNFVNITGIPYEYRVAVEDNLDGTFDIENSFVGNPIEDFNWTILDDVKIDIAKEIPFLTGLFAEGGPLADYADDLVFKELDGEAKKRVKGVFNSIQDKITGGDGGDDDNLVVYACIGAGAGVAVLLAFLVMRRF